MREMTRRWTALDYLFVATSTTGTVRGCGDYLRENGRATRLVAVDSVGSALFGGLRGTRRLPGFGAGVETPLSAGAEIDDLVRVSPGVRDRLPPPRRARGAARRGIVGWRRVRTRGSGRRHAARQPLRRNLPGRRQRLPGDDLRRRLGRAGARLRRRGLPTLPEVFASLPAFP